MSVVAGDNDAILVLLLIPRLMAKCDLLMMQIREKVQLSFNYLLWHEVIWTVKHFWFRFILSSCFVC